MAKLVVSSWLSFLFGLCCLNDRALADIWSFRIITESTTIMTTTKESLYASGTPVACSVHENCTARIFSLDAYCCQSIGTCCNWFLYTSYFQFKSSLPYKAPTVLTILTILVVVVCILFCSYCFGIVFCYFFKCGLFRHPKIVIIRSMPTSNSGSGSASADMISPKHSSSTSSTSSSTSSASSTSSSTQSSLSITAVNRRRQASSSSRGAAKTSSSSGYKSKSASGAVKPRSGHGSSNYKPSSSRGTSSSRNQNYRNLRSASSRAGAASKRYNDPAESIYIDYDNDSPFLIPPQLGKQSNRNKNSRHHQNHHYQGDTVINEEREASSSNRAGGARSRNTRSSLVDTTGGSTSESAHRQYPLGTAVAYVDEEQQLAPVLASPSSTASSLGFGASLMDAVETAVASNGIDLVSTTTATARSSLVIAAQPSAPSAANYYMDEKPPSYDDIIGRNY